jgi:hypothetical protein
LRFIFFEDLIAENGLLKNLKKLNFLYKLILKRNKKVMLLYIFSTKFCMNFPIVGINSAPKTPPIPEKNKFNLNGIISVCGFILILFSK